MKKGRSILLVIALFLAFALVSCTVEPQDMSLCHVRLSFEEFFSNSRFIGEAHFYRGEVVTEGFDFYVKASPVGQSYSSYTSLDKYTKIPTTGVLNVTVSQGEWIFSLVGIAHDASNPDVFAEDPDSSLFHYAKDNYVFINLGSQTIKLMTQPVEGNGSIKFAFEALEAPVRFGTIARVEVSCSRADGSAPFSTIVYSKNPAAGQNTLVSKYGSYEISGNCGSATGLEDGEYIVQVKVTQTKTVDGNPADTVYCETVGVKVTKGIESYVYGFYYPEEIDDSTIHIAGGSNKTFDDLEAAIESSDIGVGDTIQLGASSNPDHYGYTNNSGWLGNIFGTNEAASPRIILSVEYYKMDLAGNNVALGVEHPLGENTTILYLTKGQKVDVLNSSTSVSVFGAWTNNTTSFYVDSPLELSDGAVDVSDNTILVGPSSKDTTYKALGGTHPNNTKPGVIGVKNGGGVVKLSDGVRTLGMYGITDNAAINNSNAIIDVHMDGATIFAENGGIVLDSNYRTTSGWPIANSSLAGEGSRKVKSIDIVLNNSTITGVAAPTNNRGVTVADAKNILNGYTGTNVRKTKVADGIVIKNYAGEINIIVDGNSYINATRGIYLENCSGPITINVQNEANITGSISWVNCKNVTYNGVLQGTPDANGSGSIK